MAPNALMMRITPAHAGKRCFWVRARCSNRDHPRTRGEKQIGEDDEDEYPGSPPHTRGKVRAESISHVTVQDHPRTRGEKCYTVRGR